PERRHQAQGSLASPVERRDRRRQRQADPRGLQDRRRQEGSLRQDDGRRHLMADTKYTPRLKADYNNRIKALLTEKFGYTNPMQAPKLDKIVLNMGVGEAVADSKKATAALKDLTAIAGQKAVPTKARNSIAGFKLREGMVVGGKVTLRGDQMYEF